VLLAGLGLVGFAIHEWRPVNPPSADEFELGGEILLGDATPLAPAAMETATFADIPSVNFPDEAPALPPPPGAFDLSVDPREVPRWATYETADVVETHAQPVWLDGTIEEIPEDLPVLPARPIPTAFGPATPRY